MTAGNDDIYSVMKTTAGQMMMVNIEFSFQKSSHAYIIMPRVINIWKSKVLWHKKSFCVTVAAVIGIDRRNNEGEGSSTSRGNRRGKKRVRRYLRHMEDENDCNTSDDELQDNTNSAVSKIFNDLKFSLF